MPQFDTNLVLIVSQLRAIAHSSSISALEAGERVAISADVAKMKAVFCCSRLRAEIHERRFRINCHYNRNQTVDISSTYAKNTESKPELRTKAVLLR